MENDERELLEFLLRMGYLDGAAEGITKQVLKDGELSLRGKQHDIFQRYVKDVYFDIKCDACQTDVPLSEYARWEDDGRLCYSCASRMAKDERS